MSNKESQRQALARVAAYIERNGLVRKEDRYIVALSGGADSVCLALIMRELGYRIEAAHCNFHLRGAESDRDERFVRDFSRANNIPLDVRHMDTTGFASANKMSIEMAARDLRYAYFEELRKQRRADGILVAHHRDDNVETVLMNLTRGTGLRGLGGIRPRNGHILRPLLCLSRGDIEAYLRQRGQDYVTDSTNLETVATRNKFRLNVLPLLETINSQAAAAIDEASSHAREASAIVDWAIEQLKGRIVKSKDGGTMEISLPELMTSPEPRYILTTLLMDYGFGGRQAEDVFEALGNTIGKTFYSAEYELITDRDKLVITRPDDEQICIDIGEPGTYELGPEGRGGEISVSIIETARPDFHINRKAGVACLDAGRLRFPLKVRPWRRGDRFAPYGMKGTKLLSDFLTDRKLSALDKRRQLVVEDATGEIAWIVGQRASERFKITGKTIEAVIIKFAARQ